MNSKKQTYPLSEDDSVFTIAGFNDRPKPCPERDCPGMVYPTVNANVGRCNICSERVSWDRLRDERASRN